MFPPLRYPKYPTFWIILFLLCTLIPGIALPAFSQVRFIADPNPDKTTEASHPSQLYEWKGYIYFSALTKAGQSLWRTNGTVEGTQRLLDNVWINEIYGDDQHLWLSLHHPHFGSELWMGDGNPHSFKLVKDIRLGDKSSYPNNFLSLKGNIYFIARTEESGYELWTSDGTETGTYMVIDLVPGKEGSAIGEYVEFQERLYFASVNTDREWEIWRSDGTAHGTERVFVSKMDRRRFAMPRSLRVFQDHLYFFASDDSISGLWRTDGTVSGTQFVVSTPRNINQFFPHPEKLIFMTASPSSQLGTAMWTSTGEKWSLELIYDFKSYAPTEITPFNGQYLLAGPKSFWITDGTREGLTLLKSHADPGAVYEGWITLGDKAIINFEHQLWATDGSPQNTTKIIDSHLPLPNFFFSPYHYNIAALDNFAFFPGNPEKGYAFDTELWITDGTQTGTRRFKDLNDVPLGANMYLEGSNEAQMFFRARNELGTELWRSDGTRKGTYMVKDICEGPNGSNPNFGIFLGKDWYFSAADCDTGRAHAQTLWKTDGTASGTVKVSEVIVGGTSSSFSNKAVANGRIFFSGSNTPTDEYTDPEPWVSDGTAFGTFRLKDIVPGIGRNQYSHPGLFTTLGDKVVFMANERIKTGRELWISDGSSQGTQLVKDIYPGILSGLNYGSRLTPFNDKLVFLARHPDSDQDLWITDGSSQGTHIIKDLEDQINNTQTLVLGKFGDKVAVMKKSFERFHIWQSNGTEAGTTVIPDMDFRYTYAIAQNDLPISDYLLFGASKYEDSGTELWRTDGTTEGTYALTDMSSGNNTTQITQLVYHQGIHYFILVPGGSNSSSIWQTDGTRAGTHLADGSDQGDPFFNPTQMFLFRDEIYFIGTHPALGQSLFKFNPVLSKTNRRSSQLKIFPNPASSYIQLSWPEMQAGEVNITFWDMSGRKTHEMKMEHPLDNHALIVSLNNIASGVYMLKIMQEETVLTAKLVIF